MSRELQTELMHFEGIKFWDRSCARSVVNLLPPALGRRLEDARSRRPELFGMDEDTLRKHFKELVGKSITATENQLRLKFWCEYELCQAQENPVMEISRVVAGLCSIAMFYAYVMRPEALAWILTPPLSYDAHLDELLNFGAARMREIMAADSTGDIKLQKLQFDIYLAAENRRMGPLTQKSLHLHAPMPGGPGRVQAAVEGNGDSVQDKRIALLKKKQKEIPPPSVDLEVTSTVSDEDMDREQADWGRIDAEKEED